ncbi:HD-GYP domain-containing protein [Ferrimonas pelagia]|uniref:HD-GYP domain-containing protein n=1 Tax=Ferrimonas pelagia TaxID=1177826 RepID=A0ABP9EGH9_9GAMM
MKKPIPLEQVTIGTYVVEIPSHPHLGVRQQGMLRDPATLALLAEEGVKTVLIDPLRSRSRPTLAHPTAPPPQRLLRPRQHTSFTNELPRARKLYQQTRQLQQRTIDSLREGKGLDLKEVEHTADEFINSVFRNASALNCLRLIKDKDDYLLEHSIGVAILMVLFARHLQFDDRVLHQICVGSLLHDIGKVMIPESILNKPGRLTEQEFTIMKTHAGHSRDIIARTPGISKISLDVAAMHHEKLDGSGYPAGLKGEAITRYGRMIAICDIYDAMTADRVYHSGLTPTQALKRLQAMAPVQLDPELLHQFINCIGIYPPGTMVELSSGVLAVVLEGNAHDPLNPKVKLVYNTRHGTHVMATERDLSLSHETIVRAVNPSEHKLSLDNYL